jgi:hypothetical protein
LGRRSLISGRLIAPALEKQKSEQEAARLAQEQAELAEARRLELKLKELKIRERQAPPRDRDQSRRTSDNDGLDSREPDVTLMETPPPPTREPGTSPARNTCYHSAYLSNLKINKDDVEIFLDKELGEGGFGKVYQGLLHKSTIKVAVKTIKGVVRPKGIKMFLSEISVWDGLKQRNGMSARWPLLVYLVFNALFISFSSPPARLCRISANDDI